MSLPNAFKSVFKLPTEIYAKISNSKKITDDFRNHFVITEKSPTMKYSLIPLYKDDMTPVEFVSEIGTLEYFRDNIGKDSEKTIDGKTIITEHLPRLQIDNNGQIIICQVTDIYFVTQDGVYFTECNDEEEVLDIISVICGIPLDIRNKYKKDPSLQNEIDPEIESEEEYNETYNLFKEI